MYTFIPAHPYVGVHNRMPLMSLSLLLQQCPACRFGQMDSK